MYLILYSKNNDLQWRSRVLRSYKPQNQAHLETYTSRICGSETTGESAGRARAQAAVSRARAPGLPPHSSRERARQTDPECPAWKRRGCFHNRLPRQGQSSRPQCSTVRCVSVTLLHRAQHGLKKLQGENSCSNAALGVNQATSRIAAMLTSRTFICPQDPVSTLI